MKCFLLSVGLLCLNGGSFLCAEDKSISLLEFLSNNERTSINLSRMDPEWIGKVKKHTVGGDDDGRIEKQYLRFDHISTKLHPFNDRQSHRLAIARGRKTRDGGFIFGLMAYHQTGLPSLDELKKYTRLSQLEKQFGIQHDWTDGWGGFDGRMHWSESWRYFEITDQKRLRYLAVFASVSAKSGKDDKLKNDVSIDRMFISEGMLYQADPDSQEERKLFPSEVMLEKNRQVELQKNRLKYPKPLSDFMAADEAPDDSGRKEYFKFINDFRSRPNDQLIQQLIEYADDDSVGFGMMLDTVLSVGHHEKRGILPLDSKKKKRIITLTIAALAHAKNEEGLESGAKAVLKALGGGKVSVRDKDGNLFDLKVTLKANGNESYSYSHHDYSPELVNLVQKKLSRLLKMKTLTTQ